MNETITVTVTGSSGIGKSGVAALIYEALKSKDIEARIIDPEKSAMRHINNGTTSTVIQSIVNRKVFVKIVECQEIRHPSK